MANKPPQNLRRPAESLSGDEIKALDSVSPGLGAKVHRLFSTLSNQHAAQSGYKGPVGIAKQKGKNAAQIPNAALQLESDRISGVADAVQNQDAVPLQQVRAMVKTAVDPLIQNPGMTSSQISKQVCSDVAPSNQEIVTTDMTAIYAVEVLQEFLYAAGEISGSPRVEVFRIGFNNVMVKVGSVTQSEIFKKMILQGHYLYGCANGTSHKLTIIDIKQPNSPTQVALFDVGALTHGLHVQGRYAAVACDGGVKIVDCSTPSAPSVVGTAS